jgi:polyhydroxyalkanoate synthesis regulator phasin
VSEEQEKAARQQIGDAIVDVRNEIIVQATNAFIVGRQVVLTGVGVAFLGADQIHTLLQQAVERGEVAETEAQQTIDGLRRQLAEGTSSAISSPLASLLNKLPGVSIAYKSPAETGTGTAEESAG